MVAIDLVAGLVAGTVLFGVYQYLKYRAAPAGWADSRRSYHLHEARRHLLAAAAEPEHPRDWRPQLLVFSNTARRRDRLLKFADWIESGSGLTTIVKILQGRGPEMLERRKAAMEELRAELKEAGATAFPLVVTGSELDQTVATTIQAVGTGPLHTNTVIANWLDPRSGKIAAAPLGLTRFSQNLRTAFRLGCNLLLLDANGKEWAALSETPPEKRKIDIWWQPNVTGELMLLLGHLLMRNSDWGGAELRVIASAAVDQGMDSAKKALESQLNDFRIDAATEMVPELDTSTLDRLSAGASIVFLPFTIHGGTFYGPTGSDVGELLTHLPIVVLVLAAQDVDLDADPDQTPSED
jgi:hypothetical protein